MAPDRRDGHGSLRELLVRDVPKVRHARKDAGRREPMPGEVNERVLPALELSEVPDPTYVFGPSTREGTLR